MGRVAPYKNVNHVLRAWEAHVNSSHYRGDRLVVWGAGQWHLPESTVVSAQGNSTVEWRPEIYRYSDIRDGQFSGFKGSLCVYSEASQSGIQILSAQLGVVPIVSNVGGLPEYQAPTLPVLDPDDQDGLVEVLNRVADPDMATELGRIARESYLSLNSQGVVTRELASLLGHSILRR
jgi:glycosyltransferase involved in cell wall biosynthesis